MPNLIKSLRRHLAFKLILMVGLTLLLTISTWSYFNINYQEKKLMNSIAEGADRLTNTIKLGMHYAMMDNSRDDINQIINDISRQREIESIRIYNKNGQIKFSNRPLELDTKTNIKNEACYICHRTEPPLHELAVEERTRIFDSQKGYRLLGIISPISNDPGCSSGECHVHPEGKVILGALDVVVSLKRTDEEIIKAEQNLIGLGVIIFIVTSTIILLFIFKFVNQPIKNLIDGARRVAKGDYNRTIPIEQVDEMGELADAINYMCKEIAKHEIELNRQKDEYQNLFESVPCLITIQDINYKLLNYNRQFVEMFNPKPGDFCYRAYKGFKKKCEVCPVEDTFKDGQPHHAEEMGVGKDGTSKHWMVRATPITDEKGRVVAAMEISLDITERKKLEVELVKSEEKYHAIFSNIPNPVFMLNRENYEILDSNKSVEAVYGYSMLELINRSFLDLFPEKEHALYAGKIMVSDMIDRVKHIHKSGKIIYVNIRISPAEISGRKVLLVTTSDITKRLETEQQLIQAGKMATLGEMATGIAHELNQPLSVIKTGTSFFIKKINTNEPIPKDILFNVLHKIDMNVDRAAKIINHMRQFARTSYSEFEKVQINDVLQNAFEIFSQQLKLKGIVVYWIIEKDLPKIKADPGRLEQVFINILLNARDAIEERWGQHGTEKANKAITLKTRWEHNDIICEICDTGKGVPQAIADKIFEPFFTTKEVGKGTGLGLSISYGIIKDFNGSIQVAPNKPEGACFILKFPLPEKADEKRDIAGR